MPAELVALSEGPNILLDKPILLLGRHPECDIQLNSRKISRRHCVIAQVNNYLVVRDLGSTNGIRVNGVRVLEGKLKSGDELTVGNFRYQIAWDELRPASTPIKTAGKQASAGRVVASLPMPRTEPEPEDDDLLESCDEPVPLGKLIGRKSNENGEEQTPKPRATPQPPDPSPLA
jgi:predicted component of type VI protein secretion system